MTGEELPELARELNSRGEAYALVMLVPNQQPAVHAPPPREMILVIDTSGSMANAPIQAINDALPQFRQAITDDNTARNAVEIAVIAFGGTPGEIHLPAPCLGEHNEQILGELGYSAEEIAGITC